MEMYIKSETKRQAEIEFHKNRRARIVQVRDQTHEWAAKVRKGYRAAKEEQIKKASITLSADMQAKAATSLQYRVEAHTLALSEIGSAHRAAAAVPNLSLIAEKQKYIDDKTAQIRFNKAMRDKKSMVESEQKKLEEPLLRKAQVRLEEDNKSRDLVHRLPFGQRNFESDFYKGSDLRKKSEYQQSLAKTLHVPPEVVQKENKVRPTKPIQKVTQQTQKPKEGVFAKIAEIRREGATTPDLSAARVIPPRHTLSSRTRQKPPPDVSYFDASVPLPPQKYRPPLGLVQKIPRNPSVPTAWEDAKKVDQEILKQKMRKSLDDIENKKIAEQRGKAALRVAKLEQEYRKLESDLAAGEDFHSLRPVFPVPQKISLVGLDDSLRARHRQEFDRSLRSDSVTDVTDRSASLFCPLQNVLESKSIQQQPPESKPLRSSTEKLMERMKEVLSQHEKSRVDTSSIKEPAIVLVDGPRRLSANRSGVSGVPLSDGELELQKLISQNNEKDLAKAVITEGKKSNPFPRNVALSSIYSSSSDLSSINIQFGSDFHNIDSDTNSSRPSSAASSYQKISPKSDQLIDIYCSSSEEKSEVEHSPVRRVSSSLIASVTSSSSENQQRLKILLAEISSVSSSPSTRSSGTDYYHPPNQSQGQLRSPITSTPSHSTETSSSVHSESTVLKSYIRKLLSCRPESIDEFSTPSSSGNSYVALRSSATDTSSSKSSLLQDSPIKMENTAGIYGASTRKSFTRNQTASEVTISSNGSSHTSGSSNATNTVVHVKIIPNTSSASTPNTSTDDSLAQALSALCLQQEHVMNMEVKSNPAGDVEHHKYSSKKDSTNEGGDPYSCFEFEKKYVLDMTELSDGARELGFGDVSETRFYPLAVGQLDESVANSANTTTDTYTGSGDNPDPYMDFDFPENYVLDMTKLSDGAREVDFGDVSDTRFFPFAVGQLPLEELSTSHVEEELESESGQEVDYNVGERSIRLESRSSGGFESKESYRGGGDPSGTLGSRPSPDVKHSVELSPFDRLRLEFANISIERPPWMGFRK